MTHLCSFKVTHTKNTIWRRARISEAISSTPQACGVVFHHPRRSVRKVPIFYEEFRAQVKPINRRDRGGGLATDLPAGKKPFLPGGKTATLSAWCWVAFGEQTMVISRECRSDSDQGTAAILVEVHMRHDREIFGGYYPHVRILAIRHNERTGRQAASQPHSGLLRPF